VEAVLFKGLANVADAAVHHIGGGNNVGASLGVREGRFGEELAGGVVVDFAVFYDAAMPVVGIFTEADVGDNEQVGGGFFDFLYGALDDAGFGPGL